MRGRGGTYARIAGRSANESITNLRSALEALLQASADGSINVRSYEPHDPQSREFLYGLTKVEDAATAVERLSAEGLHTIVNETIDVADGGVSGVLTCVVDRPILAAVYTSPLRAALSYVKGVICSAESDPGPWGSARTRAPAEIPKPTANVQALRASF